MTSAAESALLAKAEEQIDLEENQERDRNRSGLPWQFYAISLAVLLFFCVILPCLPPLALLLLGLILVLLGMPLLVLGVWEVLLGVERFRVLQTLRSALVTFYRSLQPKSEGAAAGLNADHLGTGKIILLGVLLAFLGLFMSCCGIRGCSSTTGYARPVSSIAVQQDMSR